MSHSDTVPPLVVVALVGLFVVIVAIAITVSVQSTRSYQPIKAERDRAARLAQGGRRVEAEVRAWKQRSGGGEQTSAVVIRVAYELDGVAHESELPVSVDRGLLSGFAPGSRIHLLADPADPTLVAVDRARTAVTLPRDW